MIDQDLSFVPALLLCSYYYISPWIQHCYCFCLISGIEGGGQYYSAGRVPLTIRPQTPCPSPIEKHWSWQVRLVKVRFGPGPGRARSRLQSPGWVSKSSRQPPRPAQSTAPAFNLCTAIFTPPAFSQYTLTLSWQRWGVRPKKCMMYKRRKVQQITQINYLS